MSWYLNSAPDDWISKWKGRRKRVDDWISLLSEERIEGEDLLATSERLMIDEALRLCGEKAQSANMLGLSPRRFQYICERHFPYYVKKRQK